MPERASLNQVIQIGVETTPGVAGTVTKRLSATSIEPSVSTVVDQFRPMGQKYKTIATLSKEWVEAGITGKGSYNEMIYLLSSVGTTAVISTPAGGTAAKTWTFSPSSSADDTPKTYTVEHGSGVRADKFTYGLITEFSMSFSRESVEISGSMMGRAITDGIALTAAGVTDIPLSPILPTDVTVFMDSTSAALGTTKLTRLLSGEFSIGSRFGPVWVVDAANPGYVAHVETEPDLALTLTLEADLQGMSFLNTLRAGSTQFIRIQAVGPIIDATVNARFVLDIAVKVGDIGSFSDADGVYAIEIPLVGVHDAGYGKAWVASVTNLLAAL